MRISRIEAWPVSMKLDEPYTIAYETVTEATNVFLLIETSNGIIGYGCSAPDKHITGETTENTLKNIEEIVSSSLKGSDPLRPAMLLERLKPLLKGAPSSLASVDMALLDILGKVSNLPLWRLLGGFKDRMRTSVTIGIMPLEETTHNARKWIKQGFKCLKIKGGIDLESDITRVMKVREAVGKDIELRFDANQGFSVPETLRFIRETIRADLELIEQPTPKGQLDSLKKVTDKVHIPVMADESLMTLRDAFKIARRGLADMVNIKLMKVGGILESMQINAVARSAGLDVMVGCMDEAALSIAAGLHFALAGPKVAYADLDSHLVLFDDPSKGAVITRDGILFPNDCPGLGYSP